MAWNGERVELRRWGQNNLIVANPYFAKKKKIKEKRKEKINSLIIKYPETENNKYKGPHIYYKLEAWCTKLYGCHP